MTTTDREATMTTDWRRVIPALLLVMSAACGGGNKSLRASIMNPRGPEAQPSSQQGTLRGEYASGSKWTTYATFNATDDGFAFGVEVAAEEAEDAALNGWRVTLLDSDGHAYEAADVQVQPVKTNKRLVAVKHGPKNQGVDEPGAPPRPNKWMHDKTFAQRGIYHFTAPALIDPRLRGITLVMQRQGVNLHYRWDFAPLSAGR
jgi:hypothetical protein